MSFLRNRKSTTQCWKRAAEGEMLSAMHVRGGCSSTRQAEHPVEQEFAIPMKRLRMGGSEEQEEQDQQQREQQQQQQQQQELSLSGQHFFGDSMYQGLQFHDPLQHSPTGFLDQGDGLTTLVHEEDCAVPDEFPTEINVEVEAAENITAVHETSNSTSKRRNAGPKKKKVPATVSFTEPTASEVYWKMGEQYNVSYTSTGHCKEVSVLGFYLFKGSNFMATLGGKMYSRPHIPGTVKSVESCDLFDVIEM
ncbi:hypothetical protein GUITHDRAFT_116399 [Guillardia theta CCMP2712]|uniref:Uncharacterized protein n=1 Tax=Guillardia theta (strain CCMP2712) TaxID=905079 RepID=L1IMW6_GUITC|nr:hypothetical protein GUITHDRAFT_116399 [Guillardia theta CCMP2712]EKX37437.1 hypothetical protein GUITHDRAFT_116399 [Guillardia theta CCMP2712]|eukprot:XP_005824417.1 hypothetical protein GUITHDRAFT_116399 [Guillardia theta CCMP2712]